MLLVLKWIIFHLVMDGVFTRQQFVLLGKFFSDYSSPQFFFTKDTYFVDNKRNQKMRQYLNVEDGFISSPKILSAILQMWIQHYGEFCFERRECERQNAPDALAERLTPEGIIQRINGGDCGTTALAVHQVYYGLMNELVGENERITPLLLVDNYNHAYLQLDGVNYDTFNLHGQPDPMKMFDADAPNASVEVLTTAEMFKRYIWKDQIGAELILRFCQRFYIQPLEEAIELLGAMPVHPSNADWFGWVDDKMFKIDAFRPRPPKHIKDESIIDMTKTDGKTLEQVIDEMVEKMGATS